MCIAPTILTGCRIWADETRMIRVDFWVYKDGKQIRRVQSGPFAEWPAAERRAQRFKNQVPTILQLEVDSVS